MEFTSYSLTSSQSCAPKKNRHCRIFQAKIVPIVKACLTANDNLTIKEHKCWLLFSNNGLCSEKGLDDGEFWSFLHPGHE
jgi:hypothetical protein